MWEEVTAPAGLVAREEGRPGSFPTQSLVGLGVGPDCLLSHTWGELAAAPCERVSPPAAASLAQSSLPLLFQAGWSNLCPAPSWSSRSGLGFSLASRAPGVPSWGEGGEQVAEAALRRSQVGSPGSGGRER